MRRIYRISKHTNALALVAVPISLLLLVDNILSFIIPVSIGEIVKSNFLVGIILGVGSLTAMLADYIFPTLFKNYSWKIQFLITLVLALFFPIMVALGSIYQYIWIFILVNALWGLYFELFIFAEEDFINEEENTRNYSKDWALLMNLNVITNIAGPIIGSTLLLFAVWDYTLVLVGIIIVAIIYTLIVFGVKVKHYDSLRARKEEAHKQSLLLQFKHQFLVTKELAHQLIPTIIMFFMLCWIDAKFFILGGLFGIEFQGKDGMEWLILFLYYLPTVIGSTIVMKTKLDQKRKIYSIAALMSAGLAFSLFYFVQGTPILVMLLVVLGSTAMSFAWPISRALSSDIAKRAQDQNTYVLGLYNFTGSLAYFIAPMVMGLLADYFGYYIMFSLMGLMAILIAIYLFLTTPKTIKLNHTKLDRI